MWTRSWKSEIYRVQIRSLLGFAVGLIYLALGISPQIDRKVHHLIAKIYSVNLNSKLQCVIYHGPWRSRTSYLLLSTMIFIRTLSKTHSHGLEMFAKTWSLKAQHYRDRTMRSIFRFSWFTEVGFSSRDSIALDPHLRKLLCRNSSTPLLVIYCAWASIKLGTPLSFAYELHLAWTTWLNTKSSTGKLFAVIYRSSLRNNPTLGS